MQPLNGYLLVRKPTGISSFRPISKIRGITKVKKVGHAGTLDPFASGLLFIAIGKPFTKSLEDFTTLPKEYIATIILGIETDTLDSDGKVTQNEPFTGSQESIQTVVSSFKGSYLQIPPSYSAKKINGKRAYKLARNGEEVILDPKPVTILDIEVLHVVQSRNTHITLKIECSKGTYIRSLARDIAKKLNTFAFVKDLVRSKMGPYDIRSAINYESLSLESIEKSLFIT